MNAATRTVTLWRGDLETLTVPFEAFETSGDGCEPDFDAFSVTDGGQTVKLGAYEAAVEALLYEYDADYRRVIAKQRRQEQRSFGAALRRLRKQRGLLQSDFEPNLASKTIARIELGKVKRVQKATLEALAKRLGVKPEEIESF